MPTLLEDLTSGDSQRIWSSSCAVATLRDTAELDVLAAHLPEIKRATRNIPLGGALFPNDDRLKFAIAKLEYVKNKAGCLCALYPRYLFYNPNKEQEAGNVRILTATGRETWNPNYSCQCTVCGATYSVEEGDHHYTWWQWSVDAPSR